MRHFFIGLGAILLFSPTYYVSGESCDPNYGFVEVPLRAQEGGSLCWAATEQMVMESHGQKYYRPQCLLVTEALRSQGLLPRNTRSCCDQGNMIDLACDTPAWPDFPGQNFHVIDPEKVMRPKGGLTWDEITDQICRQHPFVITLERKDPANPNDEGSAHQWVIGGYKVLPTSGKRVIWVIDPNGAHLGEPNNEPIVRWRSFQHFYTKALGLGRGATHSNDYIEICPKGSMKDGKCG